MIFLHNSARTAASLRMADMAILERTGSWLTGMAQRAPEIVRMVLFSAESKLEVCASAPDWTTVFSSGEE